MDNPIRVFLYCYKLKIRITDSLSFDYAVLPYHQITFLYQSHGHSADTFSNTLKSPQKSLTKSFLPKNQYSILNYAVWRKWRFHSISLATNRSPPLNEIRRLCRRLYRGELIRNPYKFDFGIISYLHDSRDA